MLSRLRLFAFRLLYNEFAFTYDAVSWLASLGHWRRWQRSLLSRLGAPEAGMALELAHGTGDLQVDLLRAGYRTVALDLSPAMGRITRRKLRRARLQTPILRAEVTRLPLKSSSFAAIVCAFPTAFIFQPAMLAELKRVLADDGAAEIVLRGQLTGGGPAKAIIRFLYRLAGLSADLPSADDLQAIFGEHGFDARIQTIDCAGSMAQVVALSKAPEVAVGERNFDLAVRRGALAK